MRCQSRHGGRAGEANERSSHDNKMFLTTAPYAHGILLVLHHGLFVPPIGQRRPVPPIALLVGVILKYKRPLPQSTQDRRRIAYVMCDVRTCLQQGALVRSSTSKPTWTHCPAEGTTLQGRAQTLDILQKSPYDQAKLQAPYHQFQP